jgi:dihydrofolate reductase
VPTADPRWTFRTSEASAAHIRQGLRDMGALISGRRLFDHAAGWGGNDPYGVPVFVVTHTVPDDWPYPDAPFTFVTDGVESVVAQAEAAAGANKVDVAGPNIIQQSLNAELLDEIVVNLVPVLLGVGIRFFDNLSRTPVRLDGPQIEPKSAEPTGMRFVSALILGAGCHPCDALGHESVIVVEDTWLRVPCSRQKKGHHSGP